MSIERRPKHRPWLLIVIGVSFLALTAWSIYRAASGTSAVTDPDYYSHGLRFNETLLEKKAAAALGWQIEISLEGDRIEALLRDRQLQAVEHARGLMTILNVGDFHGLAIPFDERLPGSYRLTLPAGLRGEVSVEIEFERDGARQSKRALLSLN